MGIVKVLKRKDGASLVVGVALGIVVVNFIAAVTRQLTDKLANAGGSTSAQVVGDGWRSAYLSPVLALLLQVVALELLIWVYVAIHNAINSK